MLELEEPDQETLNKESIRKIIKNKLQAVYRRTTFLDAG